MIDFNRELLPICRAIQIKSVAGSTFNYVDIDYDIKIGNEWFISTGTFDSFAIEQEVGLDISTTKLISLRSDKTIPVEYLLAGKLDNATLTIAIVDLSIPLANINQGYVLLKGVIGEIQIKDNRYELELRSLETYLNQHNARKTSNACHYRLGDIHCGVDLALFKHTLTVQSATLTQIVYSTAFTPTSGGQYALGYIEFLSGLNVGLKREIGELNQTTKTIVLYQPLPYAALVGDSFRIVAGCGKSITSCQGYNNYINFGGFPGTGENWMRGSDFLIAAPEKE